jgi:hypothetical protein
MAGLLLANKLADAINNVVEESMAYRWPCATQRASFARFGPTTGASSIDQTEARDGGVLRVPM